MQKQQTQWKSEEHCNPLDHIEEVLDDYNWIYSRTENEEIMVDVAGKACNYHITFTWQENREFLKFSCLYDLKIHKKHLNFASDILMDMNNALLMGHFCVDRQSRSPVFRQTCLLKGVGEESLQEHIEDMLDLALAACERHQPLFQFLAKSDDLDSQIMSLAIMDTAGQS